MLPKPPDVSAAEKPDSLRSAAMHSPAPELRLGAEPIMPLPISHETIRVGLRSNFETLDFAIPLLPPASGTPTHHFANTGKTESAQRRLSDVRWLTLARGASLAVRKCIYDRLPCSTRNDGFEGIFIRSLEKDADVIAHCRLHWKHQLFFHVRGEESGKTVICHPEFLVRTQEAIYMVETGAASSLALPGMRSKLKAAASWCEQINQLDPALRGDLPWHYVLLLEDPFRIWHERSLPLADLLAFARLRQPEPPPSPGETETNAP